MMKDSFVEKIVATLDELKANGLYKTERLIAGPQGGHVEVEDGFDVDLGRFELRAPA